MKEIKMIALYDYNTGENTIYEKNELGKIKWELLGCIKDYNCEEIIFNDLNDKENNLTCEKFINEMQDIYTLTALNDYFDKLSETYEDLCDVFDYNWGVKYE